MKVELLTEVHWNFRGSPPEYRVEGTPNIPIDPVPAYPHDQHLVEFWAKRVLDYLPVRNVPVIYLTSHETTSRTNGWACTGYKYKDDAGPGDWYGQIVLSAKRIPIHPAMTRYLVAHEYGHHVDYELSRIRHEGDDFSPGYHDHAREWYMTIRGGSMDYGPGVWHDNVGELFANDFRILVCGIEHEFWPHPNFSHPLETDGLKEVWEGIVKEIKEANK